MKNGGDTFSVTVRRAPLTQLSELDMSLDNDMHQLGFFDYNLSRQYNWGGITHGYLVLLVCDSTWVIKCPH